MRNYKAILKICGMGLVLSYVYFVWTLSALKKSYFLVPEIWEKRHTYFPK